VDNKEVQPVLILRECRVCGVFKNLWAFSKRNHTCGSCRMVHVRSYVLTDKARALLSELAV